MKKVSSIKLLLLIITISILLKTALSEQNSYRTYESLTINENYYKLEFSFEHHSANIPDSLTQLFEESSISELTLLMGMVNPSSLPQTNENNNNLENLEIPPIYQGISLILKNSSLISVKNFKNIAQSLSISRSEDFITYLNESELTFISNPNDKFCSQHLKNILDLFLPCRNNAGIGSIINEKTFFIDKMFVGIKLCWKIGESVRLTIFMDKKTSEAKNYLKLSEQKRQSRRCMHFDSLKVFDDSKIYTKEEENHKQTQETFNILFTQSIKASFVSNYYSMDKSMFLRIDLHDLLNEVEYHSDKSKILTGRIALPYGFEMQKVTYTCENCKEILENVSIRIEKIENEIIENLNLSYSSSLMKNYRTLSILEIRLKNTPLQNLSHELVENHKKNVLTFKFNYKSHLKPFEDYENIAGGGEEFINNPFTLQTEKEKDILIVSNSMRNLFDRLLEPDFSIPFKTITFTLAIIGYLWISVWKAFSSQISYEKQRKTKKENEKNLEESGHSKDHIEPKESENQPNNEGTSSFGLKEE